MFYAIYKGKVEDPMIVQSWAECEALTTGVFSKFRKFKTRAEAEAYLREMAAADNRTIIFNNGPHDFEIDYGNVLGASKQEAPDPVGYVAPTEIKKYDLHIYVDGSFNPDTNMAGYGIVYLDPANGSICKRSGKVKDCYGSRNITGELSAVIIALSDAKNFGAKSVLILYDYGGIENWVSGVWKTKETISKNYAAKVDEFLGVMDIDFKKVDAHTGEMGNEMADALAKAGCGIK